MYYIAKLQAIKDEENMDKIGHQEYKLPGGVVIESGHEHRSSKFIQTGGPLPEIKITHYRYCKDRETSETTEMPEQTTVSEEISRENNGSGFSVQGTIEERWQGGKKVVLVFKNNGEKSICGGKFKLGTNVRILIY